MISFIKLDINLLDDTKIKIVRSHPDGNTITVLWIGMLCLAMKSPKPGLLEVSEGIPFTIDDLSNMLSIEKKTVELGLVLFRKYRMIEIYDNGSIDIINFAKHQSLERIEEKRELTRKRVARHRDRLKAGNALLTQMYANVTRTDIDIDKDKDNYIKSIASDEHANKDAEKQGITENPEEPEEKPLHKKEPLNVPYGEIVKLYHEILPIWCSVLRLTDSRKSQLKARWFTDDETKTLEWWRKYFNHIRESKFMMSAEFRCGNLDWIIKESNFWKIREGKYHK